MAFLIVSVINAVSDASLTHGMWMVLKITFGLLNERPCWHGCIEIIFEQVVCPVNGSFAARNPAFEMGAVTSAELFICNN